MKLSFYLLLVCCLFATVNVLADDETNKWGDVYCGAQMSAQLANANSVLKTNQPVDLLIQVKNVSEGTIYFIETNPTKDFSFSLTLPNGKEIEIANTDSDEEFRRISHSLKTNEVAKFEIDMRAVYTFSMTGDYRLTAKGRVLLAGGRNCELTSNPLNFTLSK